MTALDLAWFAVIAIAAWFLIPLLILFGIVAIPGFAVIYGKAWYDERQRKKRMAQRK